jgi:ribonucleoside-diphosphate reductase alpha chain
VGTAREKLPARRAAETRDIQVDGLKYRATIGWYSDGRIAEVFIDMSKVGSAADTAARDAAVLCSLLFQHGVTLEVVRKSVMRDPHGNASSPLGRVLDILAAEEGT